MPRRCTVCLHPQLADIDRSLVVNRTFRSIATEYKLSESALKRHKREHLPARLAKAQAAVEVARRNELVEHQQEIKAEDTRQAIDTVAQLRAINAACLEVLKAARADGEHSLSLRAADRIAKQIELQAKLLGDIQDGQTVNIAIMPEWHGIRQVLADALRPYPEAGLAVARALKNAGC